MTTIVEFLLARIAEDELAARTANPAVEAVRDKPMPATAPNQHVAIRDAQGRAVMADTFTSARVLAECAAKRNLIDAVFDYEATIDGEWGCVHDADRIRAGECPDTKPEQITALRIMAAPYADHPDFDPSWGA